MYEVKKVGRSIDDIYVPTWCRKVNVGGVCEIVVEAGSNSYTTRNPKYEQSYVRITPKTEGFDMYAESLGRTGGTQWIDEIELRMNGAYERSALIEGLKFILKALEDPRDEG